MAEFVVRLSMFFLWPFLVSALILLVASVLVLAFVVVVSAMALAAIWLWAGILLSDLKSVIPARR